jgi:uncharacterized membrane protein
MAQEFDTKLVPVTINFLQVLQVPFTKATLKRRLEENPYYPSLYSISEVFNWYNIENKGFQIEAEQLDELPLPFMAYITIEKIGSKDFVNVTNVTKDTITFYDGKEQTISKEAFIDKWSNIVLLAETTNNSKERGFDKNKEIEIKNRNRVSLLLLGFSLIVTTGIFNYLFSSPDALASFILLSFAFIGLAISILLLVYEIDKSNTFVKNICTGGVKTDCTAVLGSKAARVFGVSWGEIGFFYFAFLVLFLLAPGIPFSEKIPYLSYISILSAMYIPFSLFYQYKIVKQWCRLCMAVQAILFLNLFWVQHFGDFAIYFNKINIEFFVRCFIFPIVTWYSLKPIIIKAKDADKFLASYKRLSTRLDVFNLTLVDQEALPEGWEKLGGIEKGNPDAENIIFKVCSPACRHCNIAHEIFNEILHANDNVKLITVYYVTNQENDDRKFPVKHFLALAEGNRKRVEEAMDYWYLTKDRNYDVLKQKFPLPEALLEKQTAKIEKMLTWCKMAEISYTPAVYVNSRKLPSTFDVADLKAIF